MQPLNEFKQGDALLIVDAQLDFFPNGALAVPHGHEILPEVNKWLNAAIERKIPIFASRDWHPSDHCSFHAQGGPWPKHCVQNDQGAQFHPDLQLPKHVIIINKAFNATDEGYSAFTGQTLDGAPLNDVLQEKNIKRLWINGLALDYCVSESALDARKYGYEVRLLLKGTRAITPESGRAALDRLKTAGVIIENN